MVFNGGFQRGEFLQYCTDSTVQYWVSYIILTLLPATRNKPQFHTYALSILGNVVTCHPNIHLSCSIHQSQVNPVKTVKGIFDLSRIIKVSGNF